MTTQITGNVASLVFSELIEDLFRLNFTLALRLLPESEKF